MRKIVLFGLKYDTNIGDYLIGFNLQKQIEKMCGSEVKYEDLRGRTGAEVQVYSFIVKCFIKLSVVTTHSVLGPFFERIAFHLNNPKLRKRFEEMLCDTDTVIFAGGGIIECEHYGCHNYIKLITEICEHNRIDIIYNAVGFNGDFNEKIGGYRTLKKCINSRCVKGISVRENIEEMRKYTNKDVTLVCDPACYSSDTYNMYSKRESENMYVGIGLIRPDIFREFGYDLSDDDVLTLYTGIISKLQKTGYQIQLFTNGVEADACFGRKINESLRTKMDIIVPKNDEDFIKIIAHFRAILAARMHACIVSYSLNIPSINLCWNSKLIHFYNNIGYDDRCVTPDNFNPDLVVNKLISIIDKDCQNERRDSYLKSLNDFLSMNLDYLT